MTPPTFDEFVGIFMLALATALLISHPSAVTHATPSTIETSAMHGDGEATIDGIEMYYLPEKPPNGTKPAAKD